MNSLIGSPLGYIGSDGGELVKRLKESDIGLILIDEFEKADGAVFNYFLDVLENGKIVNSQAEEYDDRTQYDKRRLTYGKWYFKDNGMELKFCKFRRC